MPACIFCGKTYKRLSGEHKWSDWIRRDIGTPERRYTEQLLQRFGLPTYVKKTNQPDFTHRLWVVCKPCNEGWMAKLERKVKPILAPMLRGEDQTLTRTQQSLLAFWFAKTDMVHERGDVKIRAIPTEHHRWLYTRHEPPPGTTIFIGHRTSVEQPHRYRCDGAYLRLPGNPPAAGDDLDGHWATMLVGHCVCVLFGTVFPESHGSVRFQDGFIAPRLMQIWPVGPDPLHFPPADSFDDVGLGVLHRAIQSSFSGGLLPPPEPPKT